MFDENIVKTGSNEMELVDFRIFKQGHDKIYEGNYGVNVSKVKEIIKIPSLTELPGVPDYIEGIFDLRGVVIPVVNLAKWMQITEPESTMLKPRVIITEFSNILIGFIVHEAKRIRRINWKDIEPATFSTGSGALDKGKITGVTRIENDEVLLILDLESVVEDLGIYAPKTDIDFGKIEKFTGTALILDDSMTARKRVKEMMQQMGFQVVEAKDGVEGINKLEELSQVYGESLNDTLKIIVSDVEMPQMDGFHFAARIKEDPRFKDIPIVFNSSLSNEFMNDKGVQEALQNGVLAGYPVEDVKVTVYDGSYHEVDSSEMAFKLAASMGFKEGARKAGAVILEPMMKVEVETPEDYMGDVIGDLNKRRGQVNSMDERGGNKIITAFCPLAEMFGYSTDLRSQTQGRATYSMEFNHYDEVPKNVADEIIKKRNG